jgi:hypothetical protein
MYDIFYVSKANGNDTDWAVIKSKYPLAQRLTNITSYEEIRSKSFTKMFWVIWDDIDLTSFNLLDHKATKWDDMYVHVFKNGEHYDGICLFPKNVVISQREFHHRFFTEKKEIDIVASTPKKYNVYSPNTFEEYQKITDEMFWLVWPEVTIIDNTIFDIYFSHHNRYDRRENHVFKNLCNENASHFSGVILCSKYKPLSNREFINQYAIDKKEYDRVVSKYQYNKYILTSYNEYVNVIEQEKQPLFWGIWPEIEVTHNSIFDMYFDPNDGKYDHDRKINHAFKHSFNGKEITVNSLMLLSRQMPISQREFSHRFLIEKKEHDEVVSKHKLYDVVFISYNESNADKNYKSLLEKCPRAKRIHGVKGIHNAHIKAVSICDTDMVWIVDGDAIIEDDFGFELVMSSYDIDCVHVWRSRNPINNLEYGNGGVKLLPRQLTLDMDVNTSDMTTSISKKFKAMDTVSNINEFNTDEFTTWRSAFRECCKLASRVIERQFEEETQQRLDSWCNEGLDKQYGEYAINGARAGRDYGLENKNNLEALKMINDFTWLEEQFNERCRKD